VSSPDAKIQASMAEEIQYCPFLGQPDGVMQGEQIDGDAQPQALGTLRRGSGSQERR